MLYKRKWFMWLKNFFFFEWQVLIKKVSLVNTLEGADITYLCSTDSLALAIVQRKAHLQTPESWKISDDYMKEISTGCRQGAKSNTFLLIRLINLSGARLWLYITNHLLTRCLCHYCLLHPRLSRHATHQSQSVTLTHSVMIKAFCTITG